MSCRPQRPDLSVELGTWGGKGREETLKKQAREALTPLPPTRPLPFLLQRLGDGVYPTPTCIREGHRRGVVHPVPLYPTVPKVGEGPGPPTLSGSTLRVLLSPPSRVCGRNVGGTGLGVTQEESIQRPVPKRPR